MTYSFPLTPTTYPSHRRDHGRFPDPHRPHNSPRQRHDMTWRPPQSCVSLRLINSAVAELPPQVPAHLKRKLQFNFAQAQAILNFAQKNPQYAPFQRINHGAHSGLQTMTPTPHNTAKLAKTVPAGVTQPAATATAHISTTPAAAAPLVDSSIANVISTIGSAVTDPTSGPRNASRLFRKADFLPPSKSKTKPPNPGKGC